MSISIYEGGLAVKDPDDALVFEMDWGTEWLGSSAQIDTSTWIISGPDSSLVDDEDSVLVGNKKTQVRLSAGTVGRRYTVTNRITTNETPAQTKDASFKVLIQSR